MWLRHNRLCNSCACTIGSCRRGNFGRRWWRGCATNRSDRRLWLLRTTWDAGIVSEYRGAGGRSRRWGRGAQPKSMPGCRGRRGYVLRSSPQIVRNIRRCRSSDTLSSWKEKPVVSSDTPWCLTCPTVGGTGALAPALAITGGCIKA